LNWAGLSGAGGGLGLDKLFNGNRGPMNLIFAAGILLSVGCCG
jgi:sugar phosphate permease